MEPAKDVPMEQVKKPKFTRTCIACNNTFHEHGHKKCRTCRRLAQRGKNLEETTHANQDAPLPPPPPPPTPPPAPPLSRTSTVPGHEEFHATIWNILEEAKCKSGKFSKRATKGGFVEVDSKLSLHIPVENAATYTYSGLGGAMTRRRYIATVRRLWGSTLLRLHVHL